MIGLSSDAGQLSDFDTFRQAVQRACPDVRLAWIGDNLLAVGTVEMYAQKAYIEEQAQAMNLPVQNCVRVIPGRQRFSADSMPLAG